jgi:uncharacterized ferredoxin-like protein
MANAAQTAPKCGGIDEIECAIVHGEDELNEVATKLEAYSKKNSKNNKRWQKMCRIEALMVRESDCLLFIGNYRAGEPFDMNCGLCGGPAGCSYVYDKKPTKFGQIDLVASRLENSSRIIDGPLCSMMCNDLGYAVGGATYVAHSMMVDARPLASLSFVAEELGICQKSQIVAGIGIASLPKNPFVDVMDDYQYATRDRGISALRKHYVIARQVHAFPYRHPVKKSND